MKKLELEQMEMIEGGAACSKGGQAVLVVLTTVACGFAFGSLIGALIAGPSCVGTVAGQVACIMNS